MIRLISFLTIITLVPTALAAASLGWRTDGTGCYPDAEPPLAWSSDTNVAWKTPMPAGSNATPVLAGGKVFTCAEPDILICVDAATGAILWQKANPVSETGTNAGAKPKTEKTNGYTSFTPVTDGERVIAVFGSGVAASYDFEGNRAWIRYVDKPVHGWGHSASPLIVDDLVFIHINKLVALDKTTGEERWKADSLWGWGTPAPAEIGGEWTLFTPKGDLVRASDGERLRTGLAKLSYNSPVILGDTVYFIEKDALALTLPEAVDAAPGTLWKSSIKGDRYYSSPLISGGLVYAVTRGQVLTVLDANDGTRVYEKKLTAGKGQFYASIATAGSHVFLTLDDGTTLILEAGREYKEAGRNRLDTTRSSLVFSGKSIFIRTQSALYCIGEAPAG